MEETVTQPSQNDEQHLRNSSEGYSEMQERLSSDETDSDCHSHSTRDFKSRVRNLLCLHASFSTRPDDENDESHSPSNSFRFRCCRDLKVSLCNLSEKASTLLVEAFLRSSLSSEREGEARESKSNNIVRFVSSDCFVCSTKRKCKC